MDALRAERDVIILWDMRGCAGPGIKNLENSQFSLSFGGSFSSSPPQNISSIHLFGIVLFGMVVCCDSVLAATSGYSRELICVIVLIVEFCAASSTTVSYRRTHLSSKATIL
jgi:hypothetical protein